MLNLKLLSKTQLTVNYIVIAMLVISLFGFADATFLTIKHYNGSDLVCGEHGGCNVVTTSEYATIFNIPVALLGSLYYLSIFLLSVGYLDSKNKTAEKLLSWLPISGLAASAWFVYLQLFVINAICVYCMGSAVTSTLLFILGMTILYKKR